MQPHIIVVRLAPSPENDREILLQHLDEVHGLDRRKLAAEGHDFEELLAIHDTVVQAEEDRERAIPLN